MNRKSMLAVVLVAALVVPITAWAHEGHPHKLLGTVTAVKGNNVEVKSTDGTVVAIMLDATTAITRGKAKVDLTALKPGERVSVDYMQEKNMNMAKTVKLGEVTAAAKK